MGKIIAALEFLSVRQTMSRLIIKRVVGLVFSNYSWRWARTSQFHAQTKAFALFSSQISKVRKNDLINIHSNVQNVHKLKDIVATFRRHALLFKYCPVTHVQQLAVNKMSGSNLREKQKVKSQTCFQSPVLFYLDMSDSTQFTTSKVVDKMFSLNFFSFREKKKSFWQSISSLN